MTIAIESKAYAVAWTTKDEIKHISIMGRESSVPLPALIRGYLDGCAKRTEWGGIDRDKAVSAARKRLREAQK